MFDELIKPEKRNASPNTKEILQSTDPSFKGIFERQLSIADAIESNLFRLKSI